LTDVQVCLFVLVVFRGKLRDTVLDWEDALPVNQLNLADKHCRSVSLTIHCSEHIYGTGCA